MNKVLFTALQQYKQKQLAEEIPLDPQVLGRRLRGESKWKLWEVRQLARHFDVSLNEMADALDRYKEDEQ
jgi:ribosome-binding protein aMBF1 (putative translation factor)